MPANSATNAKLCGRNAPAAFFGTVEVEVEVGTPVPLAVGLAVPLGEAVVFAARLALNLLTIHSVAAPV